MTTLTRREQQEQRVQFAIALIQKQTHVSIMQINEAVIREWILRGVEPSQVAQCWITRRES